MNKKIAMFAALLAVGMTFAACGGGKISGKAFSSLPEEGQIFSE